MKRSTLATGAALAFLLALGGPAFAQEDGAHVTHSKQMKNDLGAQEGEPMKNAASKPAAQAKRPSKDDPGTHCTHSKGMKSAGMKEGECMEDMKGPAPVASPRAQDNAEMHTLHSKQMKQDRGVKDGEAMPDSP